MNGIVSSYNKMCIHIKKSLLTSLCQREGTFPSLAKRGGGRFSDYTAINRQLISSSENNCFSMAGFTLLEVLVSLVIVGGLLVTVLYSLNFHLGIAERHKRTTAAVYLAKEKISEMEKKPEKGEGNFKAPWSGYSFKTTVKESLYPGFTEIVVVVRKDDTEIRLSRLIRSSG